MSAAVIATLIAVVLMCAIAYVLLGWADSGALDTAVRCDTCATPIRIDTEARREAYWRGQLDGRTCCEKHAPTVPVTGPRCSRHPDRAATREVADWPLCDECADELAGRTA
jgi:hypothetical protein